MRVTYCKSGCAYPPRSLPRFLIYGGCPYVSISQVCLIWKQWKGGLRVLGGAGRCSVIAARGIDKSWTLVVIHRLVCHRPRYLYYQKDISLSLYRARARERVCRYFDFTTTRDIFIKEAQHSCACILCIVCLSLRFMYCPVFNGQKSARSWPKITL